MAVSKPKVIQQMNELGVYKSEFDPTIDRYVELTKEYSKLYAKYKKDGFQCEIETDRGVKKAPIVNVLETLRRDILSLENALGLTPAGLLKLQENAFKKAKNPKKDSLV